MMPKDSKKQAGLANLHVLPFKPKKDEEKASDEGDFPLLTKKLEKRLSQIESNLKESIHALEEDIHKATRTKKIKELDSMGKISSQLSKMLSFDFYRRLIDQIGETDDEEVDPFGMDLKISAKMKPIFDYLYYKYWRVTVTGIENIPDEGASLIVANHSGTLPYDGAMIKTAVVNEHAKRNDVRFLVEDFVYHMPFLGSLMYRIGGVRASPENAEILLSKNHLVVVFPEGVKGIGKFFRQRYKLQRFGRGGFIRLCMKTKSPLIPVGIVGAEEIHPILFKSNILAKAIGVPYIPITPTFPLLGLLGCLPLPTKWFIHFGKPISFEKYGPKALEDDLLINKLSEKVREEIQNIIRDLLRKRRSIWLG